MAGVLDCAANTDSFFCRSAPLHAGHDGDWPSRVKYSKCVPQPRHSYSKRGIGYSSAVPPSKTPRDAIAEAAAIRLRPILMTGIAAVLGLTPMALFGGANIPLARAVVGGILAALVLVLFVVPVLYVLFKREKAGVPS